MKKEYIFEWKLFGEILTINNKDFEHVWFKSYDGSFEKLLNEIVEQWKLPQKATIKIHIHR